MIQFGSVGLSLSLPVARALLEFAGVDPERPCLSVGIDRGEVCATDGATAIRFERSETEYGANDPAYYNRRVFPREYVERQLKLAGRMGPVVLDWACLSAGSFPLLGEVEPEPGIEFEDSVMFDSRLLARLELASKACRPERGKDDPELPPAPGVLLVSLGSSVTDPMRWKVGGAEWTRDTPHVAWVTIMPMRKNGPAKRARSKASKGSSVSKSKRSNGTEAA